MGWNTVFDPILLVCVPGIRCLTCVHYLISFVGYGIQLCIQQNQLWSRHRSRSEYLKFILAEQGKKHSILTQTPIFFLADPLETMSIGCRISFCIRRRSMKRMLARNTRIRCSLYWFHTCTWFSWWMLEICGTSS